MELISLATLGAKYILDSIKNSKALDNTKEQALTTFIGWVKNKLFKKSPKLKAAVISPMTEDKREDAIKAELITLLQDPNILNEFSQQVTGVRNIFDATVNEVGGNVHVGDDISGSAPGQILPQSGMNELKGKIGKITGNLHIGNKVKN